MLGLNLKPILSIIFTFVLVSVLPGCGMTNDEASRRAPLSIANISQEEIPPDGTVSELTGVVKSYEHRTLPGAVLQGVDPLLQQYAEDLYVSTCLTSQGLDPSPIRQYD